jgi:membrane protease YdiL (CAAX protease family)
MSRSKLGGPWPYFALAYGLSWLFWIPAALLGRDASTLPVAPLLYMGGLGPPVAAIALTYLTQGREGRRDFWTRIVDFRRIGVDWYLVIVLTFPLLTGLAVVLHLLTGGTMPPSETAARFLSQPLTIATVVDFLSFAVFLFVFGPVPEEIGWRGYALDRLQARRGALVSSLILGFLWSLWHLPLFFIQGTYQNNLGPGSLRFWLFFVGPITNSVLYTWIYNNNRRSTLSAILFHFMGNFTGELVPLPDRAEVIKAVVIAAAAVAVTAVWGLGRGVRSKK